MKSAFSALPLSLLLVCPVWAESPVPFGAPHLKAAVEEALWIPDPTPTDMLALTSLIANSQDISDLSGLEYATNLTMIELTRNRITDISVLSALPQLEKIVLNNNFISDMSVVAGLDNLWHLDIHNNEISDISAAAGLIHLTTVVLRINQISDISPLSGLANLEYLDLRNNQISDVSPLAGLSRLRDVDLFENQISDISSLCSLTTLSRLELRNNPLNDEACDIYIPQILASNPGIEFTHRPCIPLSLSIASGAGGFVLDPGEGEFTYGFTEVIQITAKADPGFLFAGFTGSCNSSHNPMFVTMDQDQWIRAEFQSMQDVLHVDDDAPADPAPGDPAGSDRYENGTLEHPFDSIQEAIDVVGVAGTSILVQPGTYHENIDSLHKAIRLIGMDPNDSSATGWPVIEGSGSGPVVTLRGGSDCLLTGFVLTRGTGQPAGALYCDGASPNITLSPQDPQAVYVPGEYHLLSQADRWDPAAQQWVQGGANSPCIDTGLPDSPVGPEPIPNGDRINMGVYGGTSEASESL